MVWGLACLLGFGLRLGLLRWLCARGGWHIWVLRGGCRDMAGSCGFEGAVILMGGARRRAPAGQSGRVGEPPSDDDAGQCPTPAVKRSTTPFMCGTVFRRLTVSVPLMRSPVNAPSPVRDVSDLWILTSMVCVCRIGNQETDLCGIRLGSRMGVRPMVVVPTTENFLCPWGRFLSFFLPRVQFPLHRFHEKIRIILHDVHDEVDGLGRVDVVAGLLRGERPVV